jgi:hypothetical protein
MAMHTASRMRGREEDIPFGIFLHWERRARALFSILIHSKGKNNSSTSFEKLVKDF